MSIYKKLIFVKCKRFVVKNVKYLYNSCKRINDLMGCKLIYLPECKLNKKEK